MIPSPGRHGGDGARLAAALGVDAGAVLDLSASLNPVAPDAGEIVAKHLDAVGRYPDPAAATSALAAAMDVDAGRLLLTNGGAEAIALVAAELGGRVEEPDFGLYPRGGGPLWRSNPHNPTGRLAAAGDGADVWDEAFYPLATGRWTRGTAGPAGQTSTAGPAGQTSTAGPAGQTSTAVVVGSLTKLLACPGLRVGYVLAPDDAFVATLQGRQPAWSLNGPAADSIADLLDRVDLPAWTAAIAVLRGQLVDVLRAAGFSPEPSDANFVLVRAPGLRARLAPHGILVRDCASFGLPGHVRIAVPDDAGLSRLTSALAGAHG